MYKEQLNSLKGTLTEIPPSVYQPDWKKKEKRLDKLELFLQQNDCSKTAAKDACYQTTRLILIATTKELDQSSANINGLNETIDKLIGNINLVIDTVNGTTPLKEK